MKPTGTLKQEHRVILTVLDAAEHEAQALQEESAVDARRLADEGSTMTRDHPRMRRERNTVEAMIGLYCHGQHGTGNGLCPDCASLQEVARQRLEKCPFQEGKTTCARCPVHCYKPDMRARIRAVMRYAGPRMLAHHPIMALQHVADGLRAEPIGPHGAKATKRDRT